MLTTRIANKDEEPRSLDNARVLTIADYLQAMFSDVAVESLPDAMEKLLMRIEQQISSHDIEA